MASPTRASPSRAASEQPLPELELIWEASGPTQPSPCCQTWWPAIDPTTGNIWVANSFASEYWIFKPDGTFVEAWGKPGSGNGEFNLVSHRSQPQATGAIAFASDGSFYVADDGNRRVQKFSADRSYVFQWGGFGAGDGKFAEPFGIATDGQTVYVADDDRGDIQAFDTNGRFLRKFSGGTFISLGSDGSIYQSAPQGATEIVKVDPSGELISTLDTGMPAGFAVGLMQDGHGNLFANVQAIDRPYPALGLVEFAPSGERINAWSTGGETGVISTEGDAIYLANFQTDGWPKASLRKYALPGY